jgi:predicted ATPase with chaperone activity
MPGASGWESAGNGAAFADLSEVRGQEEGKRALEVAAAGGHNLLILGPHGSGKSLLARAFSGLLPDDETRVQLADDLSWRERRSLVTLRRRLERPGETLVLAAMPSCPCGSSYPDHPCGCSAAKRARHFERVRATVLHRFAVVVELQGGIRQGEEAVGEVTDVVLARVSACRALQYERFGSRKTNALMSAHEMERWCALPGKVASLRDAFVKKGNFSTGVLHETLRLARTIADLQGSLDITLASFAEAASYPFTVEAILTR